MDGRPPELGDTDSEQPSRRPALINARELATWVGISESGLAQMRFRNEGPPYIKFGRAVRYSEDAVREWIAQNSHEPGDERRSRSTDR